MDIGLGTDLRSHYKDGRTTLNVDFREPPESTLEVCYLT